VSPATFILLGVPARLGRTFIVSEERPDATVIVVSDGFWRTALQGAPLAIGRVITVGGRDLTVVGVCRRRDSRRPSAGIGNCWCCRHRESGRRRRSCVGVIPFAEHIYVENGEIVSIRGDCDP
jgi:MacB-like periplasmic core domain